MYNQELIMRALEANLSSKEQIVRCIVEEYMKSEDKNLEKIFNSISLQGLSMSDVLDIAGEAMILIEQGNLLERKNHSKKLRGFKENRILKGHPYRCKDKECDNCAGCSLDEKMPCSPSCDVLDPITGETDDSYCISNCDAIMKEYVVVQLDAKECDDKYLGRIVAANRQEAVKLAYKEFCLDESEDDIILAYTVLD